MGDLNQKAFLQKYAGLVEGPILEIGSKDYGNTPDYREFFPDKEYIGADLFAGKGVDLVMDLSSSAEEVSSKAGGRKFKTIICFSVLEHCKDVFGVAKNLENLLEKDGLLFVSVPFSWEYHAFPDDYWRFTPSGIRTLFPDVEFPDDRLWISTSNIGEMKLVTDSEFFKIDLAPNVGIKKKRYSFFTGTLIKVLKSLSILDPVLKHIYLLPPVNVNMIGVKK